MYVLDHRLKKINFILTLICFIDTYLNYSYSFSPVYPVTVDVGTMSQWWVTNRGVEINHLMTHRDADMDDYASMPWRTIIDYSLLK